MSCRFPDVIFRLALTSLVMDSLPRLLHAYVMAAHQAITRSFGTHLQSHRRARRLSQLELAHRCGISSRHISFLESGRAQPSRGMVLRLCAGLMLPLSAQNMLLLAAGFAPVYSALPLCSDALGPFRIVLDEMIARHEPNPAMLVDRCWNVREANASASALLSALDEGAPSVNLARLMADSERARPVIENYPEVLHEMISRLRLEAMGAGADPSLYELIDLLEHAGRRYPVSEIRQPRPVLPLELSLSGARWRFLSVIAHFGTSEDATIRDLRLELLFPADEQTRAAVQLLTTLSG